MNKKTTLVGGVAILGLAGLLSKVIGMFFRIPLTNMIGSSGIGLYQKVYPTYTLLLTISTAGIPVAISRLVSENISLGRHENARATFRAALWLLLAIGAAMTALILLFHRQLAQRMGDAEAAVGFIAIAPAVVIVTVMSALRGYMQGHSNMTPTAISQLIEQVAKVAVSLPLAAAGAKRGVEWAAAGALLGITIGEGLALLYMAVAYFRTGKHYALADEPGVKGPDSFASLCKKMIWIAVPITIGSCIVPFAGFIDSAMITQRLETAGFAAETARSLYGLLSGSALSLINVPTVLATAVCIGLVPMISSARVENRLEDMRETASLGLRLGSLIGMPCAVGMSLLATPIIRLLYPALPAEEIQITGEILAISALTIFFFTQVQATTGILQGAGKQNIPMISLVAGVACKIALNYLLIAVPSINILGAPVASIVCYLVSMTINLVYIVAKVGVPLDWKDVFVKPGAATLGMGLAVWGYKLLTGADRRMDALIGVALGGAVYVALAFAIGAVRREDMAFIPGGRKVEKIMRKLKLWK